MSFNQNYKTRGWISFIRMSVCILLILIHYFDSKLVGAQMLKVRLEVTEELKIGTRFANLNTELLRTGQLTSAPSSSGSGRNTCQYILNPANQYFGIHSDTSDLFTKTRIDREAICEDTSDTKGVCRVLLSIFQRCISEGQSPAMRFVHVELEITDINDNAPSWRSDYIGLSIPEHTPIGTRFSIPPAIDIDRGPTNTTVRYYMRRNADQGTFDLEANLLPGGGGLNEPRRYKLWIRVQRELDREIIDHYQVVLFAMDGGSPSLTGSVTLNITVLDINDQTPEFHIQFPNITVRENTPVNTHIYQLKATDKDPSDQQRLQFNLGAAASKIIRQLFRVNSKSGELILIDTLDYEKGTSYSIPVTVSDGTHIVETTVKIMVTDLNDNPPVISVQSFTNSKPSQSSTIMGETIDVSVHENLDPGFFVASISVTDGDDKSGLQPIHCQVDKPIFEIKPLFDGAKTQYKLLTKVTFDRENRTEHYATIVCYDNGQPALSSRQAIKIRILDVNDNEPVFLPKQMDKEVEENIPIGSSIFRAIAHDNDAGVNAEIRYSLDIQSLEYFSIDELTGNIRTRILLDREQRARYDLTIIAVDRGFVTVAPPDYSSSLGGSNSAENYRSNTARGTLTITIRDLNDCQPVFEEPTYYLSVEEGKKANTQVGIINAHDADITAPNNRIHFILKSEENNPAMQDFRVTPRGHIIVARDTIDRETIASYSFYVMARDEGNPSLSSSVNVQIQVLDINDNPPQWIFPSDINRSINLTFRSPVGHRVAQLSAIDKDEGINGVVQYAIHQTKIDLFELDKTTGALYVAKTMTAKDIGMLKLVVEARDEGKKELRTQRVLDINIVANLPSSTLGGMGRLEGDLVIIVVMVAITLVISLVLIAAILFLRCRSCPLIYGRPRPRGKRNSRGGSQGLYSPDGHSTSPNHELMPSFQHSNTLSSYCMAQSMESERQLNCGSKFLCDIDSVSMDSGRGCSSDTTIGRKADTFVKRSCSGNDQAIKEWAADTAKRTADLSCRFPPIPNSASFSNSTALANRSRTMDERNNGPTTSGNPSANHSGAATMANSSSRVRLSVTFMEPEYQTCHPTGLTSSTSLRDIEGQSCGSTIPESSDGLEDRYGHLHHMGGSNNDGVVGKGVSTFDPKYGSGSNNIDSSSRIYTQLQNTNNSSAPIKITSPNFYTKLPASFV